MIYLAVLWDVDPVLIRLGNFEIRWYSVLFALGFIIGYYIIRAMFKREAKPLDWLDSLLTYLVIGTIVGARLGHCIFYDWDYYQNHIIEMLLPVQFEPEFRIIGYRGLASHGGAIAILIMLWLWARRVAKKPYLWVLDRVVIPIALAGTFIRLGNLMNHEIIGNPSDGAFAFIFKQVDEIPRHPVQLYESMSYFSIFIFLMFLYWRTSARRYAGRIFGWFMILLWGARFLLEPFKRSQGGLEDFFSNGLSTGQLLSIPFMLVGLFLLIRSHRIAPAAAEGP